MFTIGVGIKYFHGAAQKERVGKEKVGGDYKSYLC